MSLKTILTAGLMATSVMGHLIGQRAPKFGCGTPEPSEAHMAASAEMGKQEKAAEFRAQAQMSVPVYFHIVGGSQAEVKAVTDATMRKQLAVMNEDYSASQVSFSLAGIDRTVNSQWSQDQGELAMKRQLRKGDYSTLNVYFLSYLSGYLGYCYFPESTSAGSTTYIRDGCSVLAGTWPGGDQAPYDEGKTVTHETGHWLGLYHTFQGGCSGAGDQVSDTPAQASASSGCPVGRDSCPNKAGLDPIHNYMDYSDDSCYEEFTAGQNARIQSAWSAYRA